MEIWKDIDWIKGFEGYYQISNYGNVKVLARTVVRSDGVVQTRKERIMAKRVNTDGYYIAKLNVNKKSKSVAIHILVATAFIPNPNGYDEVNHIDYDRKNNHVENLEWTTHKKNCEHSAKAGHYKHYGADNQNYGSTTLRERYAAHPELAKELLSRPGVQNGRATKVRCTTGDETKEFGCLLDCANWLVNKGLTKGKPSSVASNIGIALSGKRNYLKCSFEKI